MSSSFPVEPQRCPVCAFTRQESENMSSAFIAACREALAPVVRDEHTRLERLLYLDSKPDKTEAEQAELHAACVDYRSIDEEDVEI